MIDSFQPFNPKCNPYAIVKNVNLFDIMMAKPIASLVDRYLGLCSYDVKENFSLLIFLFHLIQTPGTSTFFFLNMKLL